METNELAALWNLFTLVALYFVPAMIASIREHHNRVAIFVLTLLTGWTAIGWVAALVWSFTAVKKAPAQE